MLCYTSFSLEAQSAPTSPCYRLLLSQSRAEVESQMTTLGRPRSAANRMDSRPKEGGFLPQLGRLATLSEELFPHRSRRQSSPSTRDLSLCSPELPRCFGTPHCPLRREAVPGIQGVKDWPRLLSPTNLNSHPCSLAGSHGDASRPRPSLGVHLSAPQAEFRTLLLFTEEGGGGSSCKGVGFVTWFTPRTRRGTDT